MSALGLYEEAKSRYALPAGARSKRAAYSGDLAIISPAGSGDSLSLGSMMTPHADIWKNTHRMITQTVEDVAPFATYHLPNSISGWVEFKYFELLVAISPVSNIPKYGDATHDG